MRIYGLPAVELIGDIMWIPTLPNIVDAGFYDNPKIWGRLSFQPIEQMISNATDYRLSARVMSDFYNKYDWHNSWFEYNDIDLTNWPNLQQPTAKRRCDFHRLVKIAMARPLSRTTLTPEQVLLSLPKLTWDDSLAFSVLPQYLHMPELKVFWAVGFYYQQELRAICIVSLDQGVFFNHALIRVDQSFTASEITYWLAEYAWQLNCNNLDVGNLALNTREHYKRVFFTGSRQGYCWSHDLVDRYSWMHSL